MATFSLTTSRFHMPPTPLPPASVLFGRSEAMHAVCSTLEKSSHANVPVLLRGESGTGKNLFARMIHQMSPWGTGPFVKVNCAAFRIATMEAELFGSSNDGYNGGLAERGTLFLDEITAMDADFQSRVLERLQEGLFQVGGRDEHRLEARLVCATTRRLEDEVANGKFRQDLFYRINVINVRVPALRERKADIPVLVQYFYETFKQRYESSAAPVSDQLLNLLMAHHWPGNVRELENLMKRYVILGSEAAIYTELAPNPEPAARLNAPIIALDKPISLKEITRAAVRD